MATTIRAVAEAAGVSITTVSFVLNGKRPQVDAIPKETRDRVKACAFALGYRRNAAAASLRTGRSLWIGVCMQPLRDETDAYMWAPYELALLSGVENALLKKSYFPVLGSKSTTGEVDSLESLVSSGVGGLIYRRPLREEVWRMQELRAEGIASIAVFPAHKEDLYPYNVDMDNIRAGNLAAELFLKCGRCNPVYLKSEWEQYMRIERAQGFVEVLESELGAKPAACELATSIEGDERIELMTDFLRDSKPDAVLATDPGHAYLITFAAERLNLRIPEDLAVIGFDSFQFRSARDQRVSSVGVSWWRAGHLAADSIIDMVANGTEWEAPKRLDPAFIPGDTTPAELAGEDDITLML